MNGDGKLASWFNLQPARAARNNVNIEADKVALDTEWPTKLDLFFTGRAKPAFETGRGRSAARTRPYNNSGMPEGQSLARLGHRRQAGRRQ